VIKKKRKNDFLSDKGAEEDFINTLGKKKMNHKEK
jgi:hypothetical protein